MLVDPPFRLITIKYLARLCILLIHQPDDMHYDENIANSFNQVHYYIILKYKVIFNSNTLIDIFNSSFYNS